MTLMPSFVKVCGVTSVADASMVARSGADALGLIFAPESRRLVGHDIARQIIVECGAALHCVGVFRHQSEDDILSTVASLHLSWVQLHDAPSRELLQDLRAAGVTFVIRALAYDDATTLDDEFFDAILLDAPQPGSGALVAWGDTLPRSWSRPVIIAGGLNDSNVAELVYTLSPWGVDGASGTEKSPGVKDGEKVASFVRNARVALEGKEDS